MRKIRIRPTSGIVIQSVLIVLLFISKISQASIREIQTMADIVSSIEKGSLLVFDIDNTLLQPTGNLGSDQWFYYLYKIYKINGMSEKEIPAKAMSTWVAAQEKIQVVPVEKITPEIINRQREAGISIMALTARPLVSADWTLRQLSSAHIQLNSKSIYDGTKTISKRDLHSEDDALFKDGVLFVGESNVKGNVLAFFLNQLKLRPKKVVFVDDKPKHVLSVSKSIEEMKIPYAGFRYAATDLKVKNYNALVDEVTDQESAKLLFMGQEEKNRGAL